MRFTLAAFAIVLADPVSAAEDAAKVLFTKMETTVRKAKSFQAEYQSSTAIGKEADADVKGRLLIAAGNKLLVELESKDKRATAKMLFVSDGKKMHASVTGRAAKKRATDKQLSERMLTSIARAGFVFEVDLLHILTSDDEKSEAFDAEEEYPVSGFKLSKKEKIGGVETQAVEYTLTFRWQKETPATATVWIDTKTNLPVKRVIVMKLGDAVITMTETYTKSTVDGKIDEKEFELPK